MPGCDGIHTIPVVAYISVQSALEGSRSLSRWVDSAITRRAGCLPRTSAQSKADYALCTIHQRRHSPAELQVMPPYGWNGKLEEACGPIQQHPFPHGIETRFKSSQDLVIAERRYVSFNGCAVGKRPFVRIWITPLPPGCCQSLPARISHGPLSNPRAFDAMSAACGHPQGDC